MKRRLDIPKTALESLEARTLLTASAVSTPIEGGDAPLLSNQEESVSFSDDSAELRALDDPHNQSAFLGDSAFTRESDGTLMIYGWDGTELLSVEAGHIPLSVDWDDFLFGDFNNNGLDDIAGLSPSDGQWRVLLNNGNGTFAAPSIWDAWSTNVTFTDLLVGDFDNNGFDDVAGRASTGSWIVGLSDGTEFVTAPFGAWSTNVTWSDVMVGDFNNDGNDDIAGFSSNNTWWIAESNGTKFINDYYGAWSQNVTWSEVYVGDFNGDQFDDIIGRASTGTVVTGLSNGNRFAMNSAGILIDNLVTVSIGIGDFNNDGNDDILARAASGTIVVGVSDGTSFQLQAWATRPTDVSYVGEFFGEYNDDGFLDFSYVDSNGEVTIWTSDGTKFTLQSIDHIPNVGDIFNATIGRFI